MVCIYFNIGNKETTSIKTLCKVLIRIHHVSNGLIIIMDTFRKYLLGKIN